jgi:hypothetical protein
MYTDKKLHIPPSHAENVGQTNHLVERKVVRDAGYIHIY